MTSIKPDAYYTGQLESAVRAVSIYSPTSYSWFGIASPKLQDNVRRAFTATTARNYLLYNLQSRLYDNFYCMGSAVAGGAVPSGRKIEGATAFVERLSEANRGRGYLQEGWTVRAVDGRYVEVSREKLSLWVEREQCASPEGAIGAGKEVGLRLPMEMIALSPGYYMAMGDQELRSEDFGQMLRLYWNVSAEGAAVLMREITEKLNMICVPFRLKVVSSPEGFGRRDAAVLYMREEDYGRLKSSLGGIYERLGENVRHGVPALTRQVAGGLALAEDPGHGESYGLHRMMLVAEGLVRAFESGAMSVAERLKYVEDSMVEKGIDLRRPYLRPGSSADYEPLFTRRATPVRPEATRQGGALVRGGHEARGEQGVMTRGDYLEVAGRIGREIVERAVWYEGRCNWMGALSPESSGGHAAGGLHALGPELYDGTSGIALFLAELWSQTGDESVRRTAIGAIGQALSRSERASGDVEERGLYTGWPGIALAAVRVGSLMHEEEPVERARQMLGRLKKQQSTKGEPDLLSGSAGAIVGLLLLRESLGERSLLEHAAALGDELLGAADKGRGGYSWRAARHKFPYNLTGFSHGTSGIGYALLELYAATGESSYREGAEQAFAYGRSWFDKDEANWPDLRAAQGRGSTKQPGHLPFVSYWCHGAPGIGLSRLRAYQILGEERYREEAHTALQTTHRAVEQALHTRGGGGDFSLCHGTAGLAQILVYGHQVLGGECLDARTRAMVEEVALAGTGREARSVTPGLMVGRAGAGLFYLSLYDPRTAPVLFPTIASWAS
jgi:hypothetical protein